MSIREGEFLWICESVRRQWGHRETADGTLGFRGRTGKCIPGGAGRWQLCEETGGEYTGD